MNNIQKDPNDVVIINPIGKCDELYSLRVQIKQLIKNPLLRNDISLNDALLNVSDKIDKQRHRYEEVLKVISNYWGKYVHIEFSYNINYKEDREVNPKWYTDCIYNALLYSFIPSNDCLFGIFCKINDIYNAGVKDDFIDLAKIMETHRLKINEITEEEFLEQSSAANFNCLKSRLDKIESGNYELTKNGYVYVGGNGDGTFFPMDNSFIGEA